MTPTHDTPAPTLTGIPPRIFQVIEYRDAADRRLEGLLPVDPETGFVDLFSAPTFIANVTVMVSTPAGPQPLDVEIPIDAPNIGKAFDILDAQLRDKVSDAARDKVARLTEAARKERHAQASRITIPR